MELQISYCVCAKVQTTDNIWEAESRSRKNAERAMWAKILKATACPDHIHMLVNIPPKMPVSEFVGYLNMKEYKDPFKDKDES